VAFVVFLIILDGEGVVHLLISALGGCDGNIEQMVNSVSAFEKKARYSVDMVDSTSWPGGRPYAVYLSSPADCCDRETAFDILDWDA
jgi:hypothetical protein